MINNNDAQNEVLSSYSTFKITLLLYCTVTKWLRRWIPNPGIPCSKPRGATRSTQPFIFPRSIKWVPGTSGNLVVKSKLPAQSGSSLEAIEFHP